MKFGRLLKALGAGLLAGLVAALFMTVVMALLRFFPGVPLPAELGSDRLLPFIDIGNFLSLIFQFGGTTASKELALLSGFKVQVVIGVLIGAPYATIVESGRGSEQPRRFDTSRRGRFFLIVAIATFSGYGWPWSVLGANNLGVEPPGWASVVTALGLLVAYSSYGMALTLTYGFITGREESGEEPREDPESPGRLMGRPRTGVIQVRFYGADGYTHLAWFDKAMEDTTPIAYEMNGEELPQRHGFPSRALVPGYYGEASVKCTTGVELFNTSDVEAYYEKQGWDAEYVTTGIRIDHPEEGQSFSLSQSSTIPVRDLAFAGDRRISNVEISTDGGASWQETNIDYEGTRLTWIWSYDWQPQETGDYQLIDRATDGNGDLQPTQDQTGISDVWSGYHIINLGVTA